MSASIPASSSTPSSCGRSASNDEPLESLKAAMTTRISLTDGRAGRSPRPSGHSSGSSASSLPSSVGADHSFTRAWTV
eukprot:3278529-Pyramimonas_sp.AAC.1